MQFYIDIENAAGTKVGPGPITSASEWRVQRRMDEAGTWSFSAPLTDVKLAQATPRRYAHIYASIAGVWTWVGGGPIDSIAVTVDDDGTAVATVSGSDLLRELAWRTVGELAVSDGAGGPTTHAAAVAAVAAYAPTGWTITADSAPGHNEVYGIFGGESVLAALSAIADRSRSHFYLSGKRTIAFASTFADSGLQAIQARADLAFGAAAITGLARDRSSYDLYSRIIPLGAGQANSSLTLRATSRTAASGYTLDAAANYLKNNATETTYGRCERTVAFRDIGPISNTTADVIAAANALFDAAAYWLQQHAAPVISYRVTLTECPALLLPMQTIRLVYRDTDASLSINSNLMILAVDWTGDTDGVRTASLTVADSGQWPIDDTQAVVESIASGTIYQAHPQLNANAYVIAYSKSIDETQANPAQFRFRFDQEVTQLTRIVFDFQLLPLESTVKSVGSSSGTSDASGDHTHSVTLSNHTHSTTVSSHSHSVTVSGHTHSVTVASHTHDVTPATHTHSVTVSAHTHDVTISGHTHGVTTSDHHHNVPIEGDPNPTGNHGFARIMYFDTTDGNIYTEAGSGTGYVVGSNDGGAETVTSASGGSSTPTSSSGGGQTPTSGSGGGTTVSSASGGGSTPTSSSGGGFTQSSDAGGGFTQSSDAGGGTTATSASGGSHTHTVTPSVSMVYGIFRDDPANVFALTDIEYSLDGATWYYFIPGVNGYASLGDGWNRVDLTGLTQNATTLRPINSNNLLQIRRKSTGATGKRATIDAQMSIRTIIQSIAYAA